MTTIQDILRKPQRIQENMSSRQLFLLLDDLLVRALTPMACTSISFLEMNAEVLSWSLLHRRKQSQESRNACFAAFFADDQEKALRDIFRAGVDRGHFFSYLQRVSTMGSEFENAHAVTVKHRNGRTAADDLLTLAKMRRRFGSDPLLLSAIRTSRYWFKLADDFRDRIVEKYLRLMYKNAVRSERAAAAYLEIPDLFSSAYLETSRAVEVFNSENGVLTSYVQLWIRGAAYSNSVQSIGRAFYNPSKKASDIPWSAPLDSAESTVDHTVPVIDADNSHAALRKIEVIAHDSDVRAALAVSGITPSAVALLGQSKAATQDTRRSVGSQSLTTRDSPRTRFRFIRNPFRVR